MTGAVRFVAGSAIFDAEDPRHALKLFSEAVNA